MLDILKEERKPTGSYYPSGSPIMRVYYTVTCPVCNEVFEILKGNHATAKTCKGCRRVTHGDSQKPLYKVWTSMIQRCTNPKASGYSRYGGKGVAVLFTSYSHFASWSEENGYKAGQDLSIDRIDSNGNYEPANCRWISLSENSSIANRKPVNQICLETGAVIATHVSAKAGADSLGVKDASSILKVCRGKRNKANGYKWEYA